jgi:hypothetical protein
MAREGGFLFGGFFLVVWGSNFCFSSNFVAASLRDQNMHQKQTQKYFEDFFRPAKRPASAH